MICPKCEAETKVVDSRPTEGGTQIRRRRLCEACGYRFSTFETSPEHAPATDADLEKQRAEWREKARVTRQRMTPERRAAFAAHKRLCEKVRAEARETGVSVDLVRKRWGISNPSMPPSIG